MNCISFSRNEGCYNLCDTREKSAQYIFNFGKWEDKAKEFHLKRSFLIDIDKDCGYTFPVYDALELANKLQSIICDDYWVHSDRCNINVLVRFLDEIQNENEYEMCKDMINKTENELIKWNKRLEDVKSNL